MKLIFEYGGVARSVQSIMEFTREGQSAFWFEPIFHFFPDLDKEAYCLLSEGEREGYLTRYFEKFEQENKELILEKIKKYNAHWNVYEGQIVEALQDAFEIKLENLFHEMRCYMTFNPISPRYLENCSFDVFYPNSEKGALGNALHEIIHFVWFYVWQQVFKDSASEYETPHLKWILSEMVVDAIMEDERLASINPYFQDGGCVYPYFYTMQIEGVPILETLKGMYQNLPIQEFMKKSYQYCMDHETEIRAHIEKSEQECQ